MTAMEEEARLLWVKEPVNEKVEIGTLAYSSEIRLQSAKV